MKLRARFDDGGSHEFNCRVGSPYGGTQLQFAVGDIVPARYDPMAQARACMDAHNDAKAAGDAKEAQRQLAAGALASAEQWPGRLA